MRSHKTSQMQGERRPEFPKYNRTETREAALANFSLKLAQESCDLKLPVTAP